MIARLTPNMNAFPSLKHLTASIALALGLINAQAVEPSEVQVIELPPYYLEHSLRPPWRYATVPGVEVLSRCSDEITERLIDRQHRMRELLTLILPSQFQLQHDVPLVFVLNNFQTQPQVSEELVTDMTGEVRSHDSSKQKKEVQFLTNFRFWDRDSMAVYFVLDSLSFDRTTVTLSSGYLRYLLENRSPALPRWFIEGMLELYQGISLPVAPIVPPFDTGLYRGSPANDSTEIDMAIFAPLVWLSKEQTEEMIEMMSGTYAKSGYLRFPDEMEPIPLKQMLMDPIPDETRALWRNSAALFIRWVLDPDPREVNGVRSKSGLAEQFTDSGPLWNYLDRASREPVSEAMFEECFGESIEDVEFRLRRYLPAATLKDSTFRLYPAHSIDPPAFSIDDAKIEQISRVRGRLERLEINYIKELYPALTERYVEQSRKTLKRSYDREDRHPRLLAEMGLLECEAGNDRAAEPFLATAVKARVIHPRVYFELTRIRYAALRSAQAESALTREQVDELLGILEISFEQSPALPEVYDLLTKIWLSSEETLTAERMDQVRRGVKDFPASFRLRYGLALLLLRQRETKAMHAEISAGLYWISDPQEQEKLRSLKQAAIGI